MANLQKIKDLAEIQGISIRDLAKEVGIKENQIHVMCRTNSTKIDTLEKIAHVLNVSISEFFDDTIIHQRTAGRDYVERGKIEHKGTEYNGTNSNEADLRSQIAQLKSQLADKERIIELLERK